jgi:hypothetical protein
MKTDVKSKLALNQETLRNLTVKPGGEKFQPTTTVLTRFVSCTCVVPE